MNQRGKQSKVERWRSDLDFCAALKNRWQSSFRCAKSKSLSKSPVALEEPDNPCRLRAEIAKHQRHPLEIVLFAMVAERDVRLFLYPPDASYINSNRRRSGQIVCGGLYFRDDDVEELLVRNQPFFFSQAPLHNLPTLASNSPANFLQTRSVALGE